MKLTRDHLISWTLIVAGFVVSAAFYSRLPDPVPTHWNTAGEADGFIAKPLGAFVLPLASIGTYVMLRVLSRLSPRGYRVESFASTFALIQQAILAFLLLVTVVAHLAAIGTPLPLNQLITAGVGGLLMVLGNVMGKVRKNFLVGIRTPWTLASDEVWLRTHRLGSRLFVLAGVGLIASAFFGGGRATLLLLVGAASLIPIAYSYVVYHRLETGKRSGDDDL